MSILEPPVQNQLEQAISSNKKTEMGWNNCQKKLEENYMFKFKDKKICNFKTRQSRRNPANFAQDQQPKKINSRNPLGNESLLTTNPGNCQKISKKEKAYKE